MFHYFPQDIWENILQRLPSKSLCRFLSVSKQWYGLITSPDFISSNVNHNLNTETNSYIVLNNCEGELLFYPPHQTLNNSLGEPSLKPKLPFQCYVMSHWLPSYSTLGCCNGLFCFEGRSDIILWNPSIQKVVKSPPFSIVEPCDQQFGFGVNSLNGDFKVVRIFMPLPMHAIDLVNDPPAAPAPPLVEVFSLKTGTWAEIGEVSFNPYYFMACPHMYLNGCCHFVCTLHGNDQRCSLVSFDMSDEVFREVSLPQQIAQFDTFPLFEIWIVAMTFMEKECLAMAIPSITIPFITEGNVSFPIWVMKESWTHIYTIDLEFIRGFIIEQLIVKNGNILMMLLWRYNRSKLIYYNLATKSVSEFNINYRGLHEYRDTLALLEPRISI